MPAMTSHAKRFQIIEVMRATDRAVLAVARIAMIDLEAVVTAHRTPSAHRCQIRAMRSEARASRTFRQNVSATHAPVFVAPLRAAPRERPPVVVPERRTAMLAAPAASRLGPGLSAPSAAVTGSGRQRAAFHEQRALKSHVRLVLATQTILRRSGAKPRGRCSAVRNERTYANDV